MQQCWDTLWLLVYVFFSSSLIPLLATPYLPFYCKLENDNWLSSPMWSVIFWLIFLIPFSFFYSLLIKFHFFFILRGKLDSINFHVSTIFSVTQTSKRVLRKPAVIMTMVLKTLTCQLLSLKIPVALSRLTSYLWKHSDNCCNFRLIYNINSILTIVWLIHA